jgi:hypothetical protein
VNVSCSVTLPSARVDFRPAVYARSESANPCTPVPRIAESFSAPGAWVSHLVLAETMWVLDAVYHRTAEQVATAGRRGSRVPLLDNAMLPELDNLLR